MDATRERPGQVERIIREVAAGAVAGGIAGVATGLAARVAMRLFAEGIGRLPILTVEGTAFIVVLGAIIGPGMGVLYQLLRPRLPGVAAIRGLLFGLVLIVAVEAVGFAVNPGEAAPDPTLGFALFAVVSLVLGLAVAILVPPIEARVTGPRMEGTPGFAIGIAAVGGIASFALLVMMLSGLYVGLLDRLMP